MTGILRGHGDSITPGVIVGWQSIAGPWRGRVAAMRQGGYARVEVWAPNGGAWQPNGQVVDLPLEILRPFVQAREPVTYTAARIEARGETATELFLYGDIGPGALDARSVAAALQGRDNTKRLDVYLSSPGGSPFEGIAIASILGRWKGRSVTHVDGLAASAATIPALATQATHISPDGTFMIHRAWTITLGDRDDLEHTMAVLEHVDKTMANIYARKTGLEVDELLERMSGEWWMNAETARKYGFVDAIASPPQRNAGGTSAMLNRPWFAKGPRAPAPAAPAESSPPRPVVQPSSMLTPAEILNGENQ